MGEYVDIRGEDSVSDMLKKMPEEMFKNVRKDFRRAVFNVQKNVIVPMAMGENGLQSRTTNLARSVRTSVRGATIDDLTSEVYTDSPYALIHEVGGVINAKKAYRKMRGGPFLNIPTDANKTASGVTRMSPREVFAGGGKIRWSASGQKFLMFEGTPMFTFAKSVTIPARLGMAKAGNDEVPTLISNLKKHLLKNVDK